MTALHPGQAIRLNADPGRVYRDAIDLAYSTRSRARFVACNYEDPGPERAALLETADRAFHKSKAAATRKYERATRAALEAIATKGATQHDRL